MVSVKETSVGSPPGRLKPQQSLWGLRASEGGASWTGEGSSNLPDPG